MFESLSQLDRAGVRDSSHRAGLGLGLVIMTREPPKIIQLDEIESIPGPESLAWRPAGW
jgi:hypothetical protein